MLVKRVLPVAWLTTLLAWQVPAWADAAATLPRAPLEIQAGTERHRLEVELARTPAERRQGLMDRDQLAAEAGMLFLYDELQPAQAGFWMYRTRIPLDIAFLDADGHIVAVHTMQPCPSRNPYDCPVTLAGAAYHAALEVNAGYFEARGIEEGACVSWPGRRSGCRSAAE
ncbi:DUF192 domain-containing protein [Billgrantia sulfidoxydans]|uniref:DUF192 domain-containing protein n=1 Tax=Billgrantia sulfidoxydans TaxID=2733484 RepID=A0ABX7W7B1_9GAMM|nr:DUF192 domain-containing protein [Halomonas sulfidoxydans]QTP56080.1 DUF192 domain-containing protein [Halomonas sulfidoxydans]